MNDGDMNAALDEVEAILAALERDAPLCPSVLQEPAVRRRVRDSLAQIDRTLARFEKPTTLSKDIKHRLAIFRARYAAMAAEALD